MPGYADRIAEGMRNAVKMVKLIAIFTVLANLFGCKMPEPHMLDGPDIKYINSANGLLSCVTDFWQKHNKTLENKDK